jgi:hypothetical protein
MKTLVALLALSIPMSSTAATRGIGIKIPTNLVDISQVPNCADGMDPGTVCRWVPLNAVTLNVPNVQSGLPPLPIKILVPPGWRSLHTQLQLAVSPGAACDPLPSDLYSGEGGVSITCDQEQ